MKRFAVIGALALGLIVTSAAAQSGAAPAKAAGVLELTMRLMPANAESSTVITSTIELRKDSADASAPKAAPSADTASLARENGRAYGEAAAAAARDNRESASRRSRADPDRQAPPSR